MFPSDILSQLIPIISNPYEPLPGRRAGHAVGLLTRFPSAPPVLGYSLLHVHFGIGLCTRWGTPARAVSEGVRYRYDPPREAH